MSMDRTQVWREVVLEMPWHVGTSFKIEILVQLKRNLVFCQEKGAVLFFFPDHPLSNFTFLFLHFSLYQI
jgi:hypothetical protein